mgnify:FL=1
MPFQLLQRVPLLLKVGSNTVLNIGFVGSIKSKFGVWVSKFRRSRVFSEIAKPTLLHGGFLSARAERAEGTAWAYLTDGLQKRAQEVKGTHTVSPEREKSIYVSSALNAYQAIDLLLEILKKQKAADKTESNEGYYLAGGLSHNISGITVRVIESVVTWRWNYAACFISTIPSFTLLCS